MLGVAAKRRRVRPGAATARYRASEVKLHGWATVPPLYIENSSVTMRTLYR